MYSWGVRFPWFAWSSLHVYTKTNLVVISRRDSPESKLSKFPINGRLVRRGPGGMFRNWYSSISWLKISKNTMARKIFPSVQYSNIAILKPTNEEDWTRELSPTRLGPRKYKYGANKRVNVSCYIALWKFVDTRTCLSSYFLDVN